VVFHINGKGSIFKLCVQEQTNNSKETHLVFLPIQDSYYSAWNQDLKKKTYKTSALRVTRWSGVVFCCGCAIHRKNAAAQYRSRCLGLKIAVTLIGLLGAVQCLATLIMISIVKHTFCEPKIDKPPSIDRVPLSIVTEIACGDQPSSFTAEMCSFHHQNLGMTSQKNESRTDGKWWRTNRDFGVPIDPKLPMLSTYLSNMTCLAAMLSTRCGWRIDNGTLCIRRDLPLSKDSK